MNTNDVNNVKSSCFACPVCESISISTLSQSWKQYHDEKKFYFDEREWFCACENCGTLFRAPLLRYEDHRKYGEDYYNNVNSGQSVEEYAVSHFESYQRHNYDSLRKYLNENIPPSTAKRWLDVGSIGYATTFDEYDFTTIEPDERIVNLGCKLFKKGMLTNPLRKKPKIFSNTIDNFGSDQKFEGIVFHNSFYCLPFPYEGLLKAAELLVPNGELVITISTYFCDASYSHTDCVLARIEDLLPGETLWVFHNPNSLEYLCQRAGFYLVSAETIEAYGHKTMMLFRFRLGNKIDLNSDLVEKSKKLMSDKVNNFFSDLEADTKESLHQINRSECIVIGTLPLLNDISRSAAMSSIQGFVLFDTSRCGIMANGMRVMGWDDFVDLVTESPNFYDVVVLSYKFQDDIFGKLQNYVDLVRSISKPSRKSGMETLFIKFDNNEKYCKGIKLIKVK